MIAITPENLPQDLLAFGTPLKLEAMTIGRSTATVVRMTISDKVCYLKVMPVQQAVTFAKEASLLTWLKGKLPVPEVMALVKQQGHEYLLLTEVSGQNAVDLIGLLDSKRIVVELAKGLRRIHAVPVEGCPSDETTKTKLSRAKMNVDLGLVDETDFDVERLGRSASSIYQELVTTAPVDDDLVFSHGDYCLPNVIFQQGKVSGFIDMDRAGIANRYNDLAIASRSINDNLGAQFEALFFEHYGLERVDKNKIQYFRMLDEMF